MTRRLFLGIGPSLGVSLLPSSQSRNETVYRFTTKDWEVRIAVEFYDRYVSRGFWFDERHGDRHYCLSASGEENRACLANFSGSLAVVRYQVRPRSQSLRTAVLRERVRTIDQDDRLQNRSPFDRTIELREGIASDIQAFGYETAVPSTTPEQAAPDTTWCLLRQDLYLEERTSPFLTVHWKHSAAAIRILDMIPGQQTWSVDK